MRHALSSTENRQIELIEFLRTANEYVSVKKLAKKVNAVPKTILNDCKEIEEQWSNIVQIEKNTAGELHLSENDNHSIHEIFSDILKESPTFQLLEVLFFHPGIIRTELEKELFLSSSSLYRRIMKLNDGLEKRGLHIDRNQLCLLGGDERQARIFMAGYFVEVYDVYAWPFSLDQELIYTMAARLDEQFKLNLTFYQKTEFAFLIAVSLIRQEQGFYYRPKATEFSIKNLKTYQSAIEQLAAEFSLNLTKEHQIDLIQTVFWQDFAWDNEEENIRITKLCDHTIEIIIHALKISVSKVSREDCVRMLKRIYASYKVYPYEKYIAYNRELYNSLTIKKDFAVFSRVLAKTLRDLETKQHFPWYSFYYSLILFNFFIYWNNLPTQLDALRQPVKTEVCSDLGTKHAELLAYYLEKNYHNKVSLSIQSSKVYSKVSPNSLVYDLYVTNFSTPAIPEEKLFVVEDIPSAKNLSALGSRIEEYRMNTLIKQLSYLN